MIDLPKNDATLRDTLYLVKNGMALADALALSDDDRRRCAKAFAELDHLTLVPEEGMRWKRCGSDHVTSSQIIPVGWATAALESAHRAEIRSQSSIPVTDVT